MPRFYPIPHSLQRTHHPHPLRSVAGLQFEEIDAVGDIAEVKLQRRALAQQLALRIQQSPLAELIVGGERDVQQILRRIGINGGSNRIRRHFLGSHNIIAFEQDGIARHDIGDGGRDGLHVDEGRTRIELVVGPALSAIGRAEDDAAATSEVADLVGNEVDRKYIDGAVDREAVPGQAAVGGFVANAAFASDETRAFIHKIEGPQFANADGKPCRPGRPGIGGTQQTVNVTAVAHDHKAEAVTHKFDSATVPFQHAA